MKPLDRYRRPRLPIDELEVVLHTARPLRLTQARGFRLCCTMGCAWVTVPGEPRDIYLFAGDIWEVRSNELVLIEAATDALAAIRVEVAGSVTRAMPAHTGAISMLPIALPEGRSRR